MLDEIFLASMFFNTRCEVLDGKRLEAPAGACASGKSCCAASMSSGALHLGRAPKNAIAMQVISPSFLAIFQVWQVHVPTIQ
jgi:hypothetical protein